MPVQNPTSYIAYTNRSTCFQYRAAPERGKGYGQPPRANTHPVSPQQLPY